MRDGKKSEAADDGDELLPMIVVELDEGDDAGLDRLTALVRSLIDGGLE
jgi:hypothetical protein